MRRAIPILGAFLAVLLLGPVSAGPAAAAPSPGDEEIEDVEDVEEVAVVTASGAPGAAAPGLYEYTGRMHPAVVHFPIGWLVLLLLVDLGAFVLRRSGWEKWGLYVLIGTVASFVPAIVTGFIRGNHLPNDAGVLAEMADHRNLALVMAGLTTLALGIRLWRRNDLQRAYRYVYLLLIVASSALVLLTGHEGAKMVYGENYLPF